MLYCLDNKTTFALGTILFDLSGLDSVADETFIYAKEPVSIEAGNDFVLKYIPFNDLTLQIGSDFYEARPSMKVLASTISETKTVVQLRLKLKKLHLAKEPEEEPIRKTKQTYFKRRTP